MLNNQVKPGYTIVYQSIPVTKNWGIIVRWVNILFSATEHVDLDHLSGENVLSNIKIGKKYNRSVVNVGKNGSSFGSK